MTRLDHVFVPEENRIGREGDGPKIALTTLNTGRLALPAICVGMAKWATKIARECVNRTRPVGGRSASTTRSPKLAFVAGSAFRPRGNARRRRPPGRRQVGRHPDRGSDRQADTLEIGWKVLDELFGFAAAETNTAASLKARGEKPVPAEQALRDMRINRIFEGSTNHAPADRARGGRPASEGRR